MTAISSFAPTVCHPFSTGDTRQIARLPILLLMTVCMYALLILFLSLLICAHKHRRVLFN